ncbi:MAG: hypothetical protein AABY53_06655 [Bdellovibrionota bacterium]
MWAKYFIAILFLVISLNGGAANLCSELVESATNTKISAVEVLTQLNNKYSKKFFDQSIDENIQSSSAIFRSYKLFKLKRLFKNLEKNGSHFSHFELATFVYKLDKLAFADAVSKNLTFVEKSILSEARRSIVNEGLIKHFGLNNSKSDFFKKFTHYFSEAISWKYWRWSMAWAGMPKLVGMSLPPELAHKILLEGLDAHRKEVEKYLPKIKGRAYFNMFSKVYNRVLVASLFTVLPYMVHDFYLQQMSMGVEQARLLFEPLLKTTEEMASVDQLAQKEIGALDKYIDAYQTKYGLRPSLEQIQAAQELIKTKFN